jgi:hypothetical protein
LVVLDKRTGMTNKTLPLQVGENEASCDTCLDFGSIVDIIQLVDMMATEVEED